MKDRDWEKKLKKNKIAEAANDLFVAKGLTNVSMKEIASSVGYSKSSLYSYFNSKEDIISYILEMAIEEAEEYYENLDTKQFEESQKMLDYIIENELENILYDNNLFELLNQNHQEFLTLFSENKSLIEKMKKLREKELKIVKKILTEYIDDEKQLTLCANMLIQIFHGINHYLYFTETTMSIKEIKKYLKNFLFYGFKGKS
ncbi:MAG TPA: TetR/AcrR family transcriptional regulator [Candidatus Mcinerneyibacterium sp.]|nr:TetR/AcrR family transcriptional regulator [Candidatus Mcinerneyibacterium sp.]